MTEENVVDIDLMAATTGEDYFNVKFKIFCL